MDTHPSENDKQYKVLIVEDEDSLRRPLATRFKSEGFDVSEATNGEEGLAVALSVLPDVILLDLLMPKVDGLTMLSRLRNENNWGKTVPVIILTNQDEIHTGAIVGSPAFYLKKSQTTMATVVEKVRVVLNIL